MTTKLTKTLLNPGIKSLRSYLQSELNALRRAPVLLISSEAGATSSNLKPVADSCQWVQFTLGQQFSIRTVPTSISSAFPTKSSLEQTLELMRRTGASSVVSVGSGAAMDLGKAVQQASSDDKKTPLTMIPTTYSGIMAAGASHSLFLDGDEETLVPFPKGHQDILATATPDGEAGTITHATVSTIDPEKYMENLDAEKFDVLLYAVSAILLDAGLRKSTNPSLPVLLQDTIDLITRRTNTAGTQAGNEKEEDSKTMVPSLINVLYQSAALLSYGLSDGFEEEDNRSITIALGSSLIPTLFPETHPAVFISSLLPGLCHYYTEQQQTQTRYIGNDKNSDGATEQLLNTLVDLLQEQFTGGAMALPPSLAPRDKSLQGFSVPDMALSHIQSNQAVWKPLDFPDDVFVQVLQHCMKQ